MPRALILDPSEYDLNNVIADVEEIRCRNRQRFEMEQLTAVVFEDTQRGIIVGYKDLKPDEFWVRGHFPNIPIMPGVIMCEAAAQLASYYVMKNKLMGGDMVGFGGLKDVKFRGIVQPGDRFVIVCKALKTRSSIFTAEFQCLVQTNVVCEGILMGVPLAEDAIKGRQV